MVKNPFIRPRPRMTGRGTGGHKSAGILDDYAVRKNIATKEGTIEHTPTEDNHIVNKAYVDGSVGAHTESSTDSLTNKTIDSFTNLVDADQVHIQVRNESGTAMTRGQLVYTSGYNLGLDRYLVTLADADDVGRYPVIGILDEDIANNADGHLTHSGKIVDVDTSAFSVGDSVYMTTTPGTFGTRPSGTSSMVQAIGTVLRSNANNGVLAVVGAGRTNDIPNDVDHATDLQNVGTNTHSQIDTHLALTNEHLDWTASTVGTIHATNYVDNDTTDHTAFSNIGTNTHAQVDTHLANTSNPHSVDAADVSLGNVTNVATDDTPYNATSWDSNTDAATKNAIRDKIEALPGGHDAVTLNASATTGGMSLASQEIGNRAATNAQTGYATAAQITSIESNATHTAGDGSDHADVASNTTHRGLSNNPHSTTKTHVGLSNVTNVATSDTAYNATSWNTNTDNATKNAIRDKVETMDTAIGSNTSASHAESHDAASHSDITSTGANIDSAVSLKHSNASDHAESHDIASHSDTTATGAELETLTGGGDTTLHDHAGISENTTHRGSDGSDHSDVVTNTAKVSFTKTEIKGVINHGGTAGTGRPTGFDSVEWIGTVEPTNAANDDTWIDTT